jgi:hypothetical protein
VGGRSGCHVSTLESVRSVEQHHHKEYATAQQQYYEKRHGVTCFVRTRFLIFLPTRFDTGTRIFFAHVLCLLQCVDRLCMIG